MRQGNDVLQPEVFSNVTLVRLVQLRNAHSAIEVISAGIVILTRLLQPKNADTPIEVTP